MTNYDSKQKDFRDSNNRNCKRKNNSLDLKQKLKKKDNKRNKKNNRIIMI